MDDTQSKTLRIVLVGKTGSGKSATANTILGEDKFPSAVWGGSVTKECQKASKERMGRNILIVDTPGLFNTEDNYHNICQEISRCVLFSSPGPHAIILVLMVNRYTEEELQVFGRIKALFGDSVTKHMIILFTHKDELKGITIHDFIACSNVHLKYIVQECGARYCAFNNIGEKDEKETQVQELMQMIEKVSSAYGHFTDKIYENVEERLKQNTTALIKIFKSQLEKEIQLVREEYGTKSGREMEEKIKLLQEQYAVRIRNIREEADSSQRTCNLF